MVAIGMSAASVAQVRYVISGLWEVVASLRVLRDPGRHAVHLPWVRRVRPDLAQAGLIGTEDSLLWRLVPSAPAYLPDFLTPALAGMTAGLDEELAALRATPQHAVRRDLRAFADEPLVRELCDDPAASLDRLAREISAYWLIAIAPDWPRIRRVLEADILARSRLQAERGTAEMLNSLHERVCWDREGLRVRQPHCDAPDRLDSAGLILVPSVFVWPAVLSVSTGVAPQLAYPARGLATVWDDMVRVTESLSAILGRGRARLLAEMRAPVSTTELAERTGITPGGVSQHLAALRAAGLATAHRDGRMILNVRTPVADALVSAATGAQAG